GERHVGYGVPIHVQHLRRVGEGVADVYLFFGRSDYDGAGDALQADRVGDIGAGSGNVANAQAGGGSHSGRVDRENTIPGAGPRAGGVGKRSSRGVARQNGELDGSAEDYTVVRSGNPDRGRVLRVQQERDEKRPALHPNTSSTDVNWPY